MPDKCGHDQNREKVCAPCGRKINAPVDQLKRYRVTPKSENLIKKFLQPEFSLLDPRFPSSICTTCRQILSENDNDTVSKRPLKNMPNYEDIVLARTNVRSSTSGLENGNGYYCNCYICQTGRLKGHVAKKLSIGESLIIENRITPGNGLFARSERNLEPLKTPSVTSEQLERRCDNCLSVVARGKSHICSHVKSQRHSRLMQQNIVEVAKSLPEKRKLQIASALMNQCKKDNQNTLEMNTTGRKKTVYFTERKKNVQFSAENLDDFQIHCGVSDNHMKKLTNFIRCTAGRGSIPSQYANSLSKKSKVLKDLYYSDIIEFEVSQKMEKQKRPVVWANAEALVEAVISEREYIGRYVVKVMADGGQSFLKVCLSIIPESEIIEEPTEPKRRRYSEGGSVANKPKSTSVHRLLLLCVVPDVSESYYNMQKIFSLTEINNISFKFVSDFKLLLTVNGQQTATSTYPCPFCFITLQDLRNRVDFEGIRDKDPRKLKTYADLRADFRKYECLGNDKKMARVCNSTIHAPLFRENDTIYVAEKCVIPELHILQGVVNHLFWNGLVPLLGREEALIWPAKLNLVSKNYHGEVFEGNACRKLLLEADKLLNLNICNEIWAKLSLIPYVAAFKAMNKIVECSFSTRSVGPDLTQHIDELRKALLATNVTETLKIHVALEHIEESLGFLEYDVGLGLWSEQAGESVHREFLKFWDKRKVNDLQNPSYVEKLQDSVAEFSSKHI